MSDTATLPPVSVEKKCRIEEVFDPTFIELIRLVPRNPYVRALILRLAGKMPPAECETFEQVKEWVETTCKPRTLSRRVARSVRDDGISIPVEFSETEYGRAAYSVRCSGSADFQIEAEDLVELVQSAIDAGEGIDGVVELVAQKIDEDAWVQCEPDTDASGDYDYSDHDVTGTEDSDASYSKTDIRAAVLAFMRQRHPELAAEL
jgi:hypothetical protein